MATRDANGILARLSGSDRELLEPRLHAVQLKLRQQLERPQRRIRAVYFIERGLAFIVATSARRREQVEAGIVGRDGMTGTAVILGVEHSPHDTFVQQPGSAQCVSTGDLRQALAASDTLLPTLMRYVHVTTVALAHTALANARGTIEQRLARWLLMVHDRSESDEIHLTHEFLSLMLGNRRAGVTTSLNVLDARGLIGHSRGCITILKRDGLKELAGDLYGVPEAEYTRVLGPRRPSQPTAAESHAR
jgi:CRP-like cAMP-binding protein